VVAPFGCPETINADGDQGVDRGQRGTVVDHAPYAAHNPPEWPVADQNGNGQQRHGNDGNHEVGDRLVDDQSSKVGAKLLLVLVREQNEEVGHGADGGKEEEQY